MAQVEVKRLSKHLHEMRLKRAQRRLTNAVIQDSTKYVPHRGGKLRASVHNATVLESGIIIYNTPYAHYQWKGKDMIGMETERHWARKNETKKYNGKMLVYREPGTTKEWTKEAERDNLQKWNRMVGRILEGKG